jgi:hypothetical protein
MQYLCRLEPTSHLLDTNKSNTTNVKYEPHPELENSRSKKDNQQDPHNILHSEQHTTLKSKKRTGTTNESNQQITPFDIMLFSVNRFILFYLSAGTLTTRPMITSADAGELNNETHHGECSAHISQCDVIGRRRATEAQLAEVPIIRASEDGEFIPSHHGEYSARTSQFGTMGKRRLEVVVTPLVEPTTSAEDWELDNYSHHGEYSARTSQLDTMGRRRRREVAIILLEESTNTTASVEDEREFLPNHHSQFDTMGKRQLAEAVLTPNTNITGAEDDSKIIQNQTEFSPSNSTTDILQPTSDLIGKSKATRAAASKFSTILESSQQGMRRDEDYSSASKKSTKGDNDSMNKTSNEKAEFGKSKASSFKKSHLRTSRKGQESAETSITTIMSIPQTTTRLPNLSSKVQHSMMELAHAESTSDEPTIPQNKTLVESDYDSTNNNDDDDDDKQVDDAENKEEGHGLFLQVSYRAVIGGMTSAIITLVMTWLRYQWRSNKQESIIEQGVNV